LQSNTDEDALAGGQGATSSSGSWKVLIHKNHDNTKSGGRGGRRGD
jgi:hypothetical protein